MPPQPHRPAVLGQDARLVAGRLEPLADSSGEGIGLGDAVQVGDETDDGHGQPVRAVPARWPRRPPRRGRGRRRRRGRRGRCRWARNSTLPSAPVRGETMIPIIAAPWPARADVTRSSTSAQTAGSLTTPLPRDTSARPASNCGLISTTTSAPEAARSPRRAGADRRREMNDRSATTTWNGLAAEVVERDAADVGALQRTDPRVGPEPLVKLGPSDVDGDHRAPRPAAAGSR